MAEIRIGNRAVEAGVIKLRAGAEGKALSDMTRDGVNNVAFKIDGDTYVASAKGLDVAGLKEWDALTFEGRTGHVLKADREELAKGAIKKWGLVGAGIGAVGMVASGLGLGALFGAFMPLAELALMAPIGAVLFGGVATGWAALTNWNNGRQATGDKLGKYAA